MKTENQIPPLPYTFTPFACGHLGIMRDANGDVIHDYLAQQAPLARFMAKACNQHAALINALEVVLSSIEWSYPAQRMTEKEQADFIRSAIAKATL